MKYFFLPVLILFGGLTPLSAEPLFDISPLTGTPLRGELVACDSETVLFRVDEKTVSIPLQETLKIEVVPENAKIVPKPKGFSVLLTDGTRVSATELAVTGNSFLLKAEFWGELSGPSNRVRTVRFVEGDSSMTEKWNRLLERDSSKDLLVIRKEDSIDFVDGIVGAINEKSVLFLLDGEEIPVSREKVFGVIYHRGAPSDVPPQGEIIHAGGDRIAMTKFDFRDGKFQASTPIGLTISGSLEGVRLVDFRPGRLDYLSEMKPRTEEYTPFFDVVWKVRNNKNFDGGAIRVGGRTYERGLCIHSRTLLSYRLAGEYRRFQAVMGIDELVGQKGHVRVTIKADDRVLFEGEVSGGTDPLPLDYDVAGVRDLEILVDFGEDLDIADHLALADARLVK
jgi:hypothetical protein